MCSTINEIPLIIKENVPLAPFTSFGIGGPARYFVTASNLEELRAALRFAQEKGIAFHILAGGTNILVSDHGFRGVVIKIGLYTISRDGNLISAQAGAELGRVVDQSVEWGLSGLELLAGIPGTIGGAVRGNAGAFGLNLGELVKKVLVVDAVSGEQRWLNRDACNFGYRTSLFKKNSGQVVVSVDLELAAGQPEEIHRRIRHTLERRSVITEKEKSVGSYFINPIPDDELLIKKFEADRKVQCRNCMIPAGWLIDQAGLRGTRIGGAMISEKHGNYLINTGNATARDVVRLARLIQEKVRERMGVDLQEEVNYIGFE